MHEIKNKAMHLIDQKYLNLPNFMKKRDEVKKLFDTFKILTQLNEDKV